MRKRKISKRDWLRRDAVPKYLETGVLPLHKHHTIPKHHGGENSPLLELNYKQHAETHLEYGKKHNCKRCLQSYKTLMGMWNVFIEEVEKYSEEKALDLVDSYEDYLGKIDDEADVNKDDLLKDYQPYVSGVFENKEFLNPGDESEQDVMKETVSAVLSTLYGREKEILEMSFGLGDYYRTRIKGTSGGSYRKGVRLNGVPLNEIADKLNLTRERVRQYRERAIERLYNRARRWGFKYNHIFA